MSSKKTIFLCDECGYESVKWQGRCPSCSAWNTLRELAIPDIKKGGRKSRLSVPDVEPVPLGSVISGQSSRISTGIGELDRVLGGGAVKGSVVLFSGEPGIGKSTLLLQICGKLQSDVSVLYVSGEESAEQIKMRADRLGIKETKVFVFNETDMDAVLSAVEKHNPDLVIVDSIQTIASQNIPSVPGSVSQVRESAMELIRVAKKEGITFFLVGHVNKEGVVAGPKVLEHMVDTVLYFEGERNSTYRLLRSIKNRFGSTNEIGVFEMGESGLVEILNPSALLLEGRPASVSGTSVVAIMEGSRPLLVEVQALVGQTSFSVPRRVATGYDFNRMILLIAVLEKRMGLNFSASDAYINVVGGFRVNEPSTDLGVVLSLASSLKDKPIDPNLVAIGEIGLAGEIRSVSMLDTRIAETQRMGIQTCIVPLQSKSKHREVKGVEILYARDLDEVFTLVF
jgi:DNA repair protein RadA/Sms